MKTLALFLTTFGTMACLTQAADSVKPIRALYVTGGCCHDYEHQKQILSEGVSARANVEWTIVEEGGSGTKHVPFEQSIYQNPDWAKGYDIVVHNECFSDDNDPGYIERFLKPHREGLPAVVIHCSMHTFRALNNDNYRDFLGVKTTHHGPQHPLDVKVLAPQNPVMKGFPADFKTGPEELYAIDRVFPTATALAEADEKKKENGEWVSTGKENTVVWLNQYEKGRVFGTTLAHNNSTLEKGAYLDLLTRGILWACDKLDENGKPKPGYEHAAHPAQGK